MSFLAKKSETVTQMVSAAVTPRAGGRRSLGAEGEACHCLAFLRLNGTRSITEGIAALAHDIKGLLRLLG